MIHLFRTIHIVSGVIWVGGVFFMAMFLLPSAKAVGPAAGPMMVQLTQVRQFPRWLLITGFLTIAAGLWLYMLAGGSAPGWMASGPAKVYGVGAVLAIIAWFIGMTMSMPLAKKLGALNGRIAASGVPPTADEKTQIAAMQARLGMLAAIAATLLIITTATMAVARYVT
ncbi:MAG: hypothetical protein IPP90_11095 [Gemmatimonadaceae bacterium]|nr:hypothetical protein [Gemmatimonadaceae bacterium]